MFMVGFYGLRLKWNFVIKHTLNVFQFSLVALYFLAFLNWKKICTNILKSNCINNCNNIAIQLQVYAEKIRFSYQYVHKLFKKKLGTSFTEEKKDTVYIRHIKL